MDVDGSTKFTAQLARRPGVNGSLIPQWPLRLQYYTPKLVVSCDKHPVKGRLVTCDSRRWSIYFRKGHKKSQIRAAARKPRDAACLSYAQWFFIVICFCLRKVKAVIAPAGSPAPRQSLTYRLKADWMWN